MNATLRVGRGPLGAGLVMAVALLAALSAAAERAEAAVTTFEVEMVGANEVPAATSPGSGLARFTFNDVTRELTYVVWVRGISSSEVTAAHIHRAPAGTAGPAVYTLATSGFDVISGSITLTEADVADLKAGNLYVNFHTKTNPSGSARGQLKLPGAAAASAVAAPTTGDGGLIGSNEAGNDAALLLGIGVLAGAGLLGSPLRARRSAA